MFLVTTVREKIYMHAYTKFAIVSKLLFKAASTILQLFAAIKL